MRIRTALVITVTSMASFTSCGRTEEPDRKTSVDGQVKVLATVNGVPITTSDLDQRLRKLAAGGGAAHDVSDNVLNTIVRDELIYQESLSLGLDGDPEYRLKLEDLEAQLRAFRRQQLAARFRAHVRAKAAVTDEEARDFFEKNADAIRAKLHVLQILRKGQFPEMVRDQEELKSGVPFEKVASRRFPAQLGNVRSPWDLGELRWHQVPQPWKGIVERLAPGQVSEIIKGENERFWLIKLVGRSIDPGITFDTEKERIVELLREQKEDALYDATLAELKAKARVVYSK